MTPGKLAAQVAHAAVATVYGCNTQYYKFADWVEEGMPKIVLSANDEMHLLKLQYDAREKGIVNYLVKDAGRTELEEGTVTCLAIGPDEDAKIDSITGTLKLL